MTISADELRPGLQQLAREQAPTMNRLRRALEIVYRGRTGGRTVDEILEVVLLAVARAHERRTEEALETIRQSMTRVLADAEAARRRAVPAGARDARLRRADLFAIADATSDILRFEDAVKKRIAEHDESLARAVADAVGPTPPPVIALNRARSAGSDVRSQARRTLAAWAAGRTLPERGFSFVVPNPAEPRLAAAMQRLQDALEQYAAHPGGTDAAASAATAALQREWAAANEALRQAAGDFDVIVHGDVLPGRPGGPAGVGASADAAARAESVGARLRSTPAVADLPRPQLLDELKLSDLDVIAEGSLREPINRGGLEKVQLTSSALESLPTTPKRLAARLASFFRRWQRAHLIGPGFGSELSEGVMLAPEGVNQLVQNKGFENALRQAHGLGPDVPLTARAKGRRLVIPLRDKPPEIVDILESVHYEIPRAGRDPIRFDITVNPDGTWTATHHGSLDGFWPADVPLSGTR